MAQFDLSGKVAIISGASRGIGAAIARSYVTAGAKVVVSSRKVEDIETLGAEINAQHPESALAVAAHAGRREETERLVEQAVERFGRVDIAVNNAATNPHFGSLLNSEPWQWDKILELNVKGYFWLCQLAARQMIRQGQGGKIINMASVTGIKPGPMMGIYSVSKAAVIMLTQVLAAELGADNIQVNAIAPGYVNTRFSAALWQNPVLERSILERTPAGRIAEPEEIAGIAQFLASSASDFITGAVFKVDGGYSLL
jgi:NAD(P)-dependent dehydrogenase (short-subunit alcohol dehydrogenase family)